MNIKNNKQLAKNIAYTTIRDLILNGEIAIGSFIAEEHMAAQLKISRTPIRNALARLEAERLIDIIPNRGALVRELKPKEIIEIYDVRTMIEKKSAHLFCTRDNAQIPEHMYNIINEMEQPLDNRQQIKLDLEFHRLLVELSLNDVLLNTYDSIGSRSIQAALIRVNNTKNYPTEEIKHHHQILKAIENKNADTACKILGHHLKITTPFTTT